MHGIEPSTQYRIVRATLGVKPYEDAEITDAFNEMWRESLLECGPLIVDWRFGEIHPLLEFTTVPPPVGARPEMTRKELSVELAIQADADLATLNDLWSYHQRREPDTMLLYWFFPDRVRAVENGSLLKVSSPNPAEGELFD
jgi:hypothetical protein